MDGLEYGGHSRPTYTVIDCGQIEAKPEFLSYPKMPRLLRPVVITEKIDGTNAQILITEDGKFLTGSRNRWITPADDNYGFARWAQEHREELTTLGPGRHFGEWWGKGIQRGYDVPDKRFSLFNVRRWCLHDEEPKFIDPDVHNPKKQERLPPCCGLVPVIAQGNFSDELWRTALAVLAGNGSYAAPGFNNPEGIVIHHIQSQSNFKITLGGDGAKGEA